MGEECPTPASGYWPTREALSVNWNHREGSPRQCSARRRIRYCFLSRLTHDAGMNPSSIQIRIILGCRPTSNPNSPVLIQSFRSGCGFLGRLDFLAFMSFPPLVRTGRNIHDDLGDFSPREDLGLDRVFRRPAERTYLELAAMEVRRHT